MQIEADVRFTVTPPTPERGAIEGRVTGHGSELVISFSRSASLSGIGAGRAARMITATVAQGLTIEVTVPAGTLAVIGGERTTPWWQLPFTRSRHLRLGPVRVLRSCFGGPRIFAVAWPSLSPHLTPVQEGPRWLRTRRTASPRR